MNTVAAMIVVIIRIAVLIVTFTFGKLPPGEYSQSGHSGSREVLDVVWGLVIGSRILPDQAIC